MEYGGERREWHALFCAKGKLYSYRLHLGAFQDPLSRQIRYHEQRAVNLTLLREAAGLFEGGHDFAAFANNPRDKVKKQMLDAQGRRRCVRRVEVEDEGNGDITIRFYLDGALYKMVRNMVGAMLNVATGRYSNMYKYR